MADTPQPPPPEELEALKKQLQAMGIDPSLIGDDPSKADPQAIEAAIEAALLADDFDPFAPSPAAQDGDDEAGGRVEGLGGELDFGVALEEALQDGLMVGASLMSEAEAEDFDATRAVKQKAKGNATRAVFSRLADLLTHDSIADDNDNNNDNDKENDNEIETGRSIAMAIASGEAPPPNAEDAFAKLAKILTGHLDGHEGDNGGREGGGAIGMGEAARPEGAGVVLRNNRVNREAGAVALGAAAILATGWDGGTFNDKLICCLSIAEHGLQVPSIGDTASVTDGQSFACSDCPAMWSKEDDYERGVGEGGGLSSLFAAHVDDVHAYGRFCVRIDHKNRAFQI